MSFTSSNFTIVFLLTIIYALSANGVDPFACTKNADNFPFCQANLPLQDRVRDLITRLTLDEKVSMLGNNAGPISRLGIRGYEWWSEALHGVSNVGPGTKFGGKFPGATSFPQVISTAASFNVTLWEAIGQVVSDEARAMYNGGFGGLTYWSPNVNIFRDPRWGRGQETAGEDPYVVGTYAASYVRGLQGYEGDSLKVAACCKHFTAYDLDNWNGVDRFHFNAVVSKQDMEDTFNVPFMMCVKDGNVASIMCSYNQVNGVPTCADADLLTNVVRRQWRLNGYIVSDCDSVDVLFDQQHYTTTAGEAAADAIKAGLDLDCGSFLGQHAEEAVRRGILNEANVDNALFNTLSVQMRLGMFNGDPSTQRYGGLGPNDVCSPAHQELALEAARQGIVLLKNNDNALPLSTRRHRTVAVIGPNSDVTTTMIGNYAGVACAYTTPLQGISGFAKTVHHRGCDDVACASDSIFDGAVTAAREADATVLFLGLDQSIEAEFRDRDGLLLPGMQQKLASDVAKSSKGPTVLVLMSGGPIDVSFANDDPNIDAIVWAGYPGQAGGKAIAEILFGLTNPGGKLPMTWYPNEYVTNTPMTNMDMRPSVSKSYPGRTYRFYAGRVVYPFGYGLSYTKFVHTLVSAPTSISIPLYGRRGAPRNASDSGFSDAVRVTHAKCRGVSVGIRSSVRNVGGRDGTEIVSVFSSPPRSRGAPRRQLVGFQKVHVAAGEEQTVSFNVHVCKFLSLVDESGTRRIPIGLHTLYIGDVAHSLSILPLN